MGYNTDFHGVLDLDPPIKPEHAAFIREFSTDGHHDCGPGGYCQWTINESGELEWDQNEKFYSYLQWLEYLIGNYFGPWGYHLNGTISFQGADSDDRGDIVVTNSDVEVRLRTGIIDDDASKALLAACQAVVDNWESGDLAAAVRKCQVALNLAMGK